MKSIIDIQKTGNDGSMRGVFLSAQEVDMSAELEKDNCERERRQQETDNLFKELGVERIC